MAIALYVLIPQLTAATRFLDELRTAHLGWVVVVAVMSAVTYLGAGLGMVGAVPVRLHLVRYDGTAGLVILQPRDTRQGGRNGYQRAVPAEQDLTFPMAASAVGLNPVAGLLVRISLLVLAGRVASIALPVPDMETTAIVAAALILVSGLRAPARRAELLTKSFCTPSAPGLHDRGDCQTPPKLLAVFTGSAIITVAIRIAMVASLTRSGPSGGGDGCRRLSRRVCRCDRGPDTWWRRRH